MKLKLFVLASTALGTLGAFGAAGIYEELIWTTTTTPFSYGTSTFYEIDNDTSNLFGAAEFDGSNLGIFNTGDELYLTGQQKSFKNNGTDVTGHTLHWSVGGGGSGSISYGFQSDLGSGNQQWGADSSGTLTANVISGLAPGNYTLSVWSSISTNSTDADPTIFNNKGGSNYLASFTIVPEPSAALLGGLGALALLRRRRA